VYFVAMLFELSYQGAFDPKKKRTKVCLGGGSCAIVLFCERIFVTLREKKRRAQKQRIFFQICEVGGLGIFQTRTSLNLARGKRGK